MISIACIYNNKDIPNNWLLKGLKSQIVEFELINEIATPSARNDRKKEAHNDFKLLNNPTEMGFKDVCYNSAVYLSFIE